MLWSGWGDPQRAVTLAPHTLELLRVALGITHATNPVAFEQVELPAPRLVGRVHERFAAVVGPEKVLTDRASRIRHTRGKSTADLLRIRAGEASAAPDAILAPGSHDEVLALLTICEQEGLAVVPYGAEPRSSAASSHAATGSKA